jgi:hypothetical protein
MFRNSKNLFRKNRILLSLGFFFFLAGSAPPLFAAVAQVAKIAELVSRGVGTVGKSFQGTRGAPIIILEERHDSLPGQIQHAIVLARLHRDHRLTRIALEGYLNETPKIDTGWFSSARKNTPDGGVRVAVQLLKEGEISAAEFLALAFEDVTLYPTESAAEYDVTLNPNSAAAPTLYLYQIALKSLKPTQQSKVNEMAAQMKALKGEAKEEKTREILSYIFSADPWVAGKKKKLEGNTDLKVLSLSEHAALLQDIIRRAGELKVDVASEQRSAMENYSAFIQGRARADITMVAATEAISDQKGAGISAMVIGAAHTHSICEKLKAAKRSFAVVTPLALSNGSKERCLSDKQFDRKYHNRSVFGDRALEVLLDQFYSSTHQKKPKPVLNEPWFQAKAVLYHYTQQIVEKKLGVNSSGQNPPPPPPEGPNVGGPDFPDDAFNGKYVYIDPRKITIYPANDDGKDGGKKQVAEVMFPVVLRVENSKESTQLWVKAAWPNRDIAQIDPDPQGHDLVEKLLKEALAEKKKEPHDDSSAETEVAKIDITNDVVAVIGKDSEQVRAKKMATS